MPEVRKFPEHIAIIMDGNGRWARRRLLPRQAGHRAGLTAARHIIEECVQNGIRVLTLFAFSSENWKRPESEVGNLIGLFVRALENEVAELHNNNIHIQFIGDRKAFSSSLQKGMKKAEELTQSNTGLTLNIAASYGGRWDIVQAVKNVALDVASERIDIEQVDESRISKALCLSRFVDPDLFIRTGGEQRISNFLLWNLAYTELYFTDILWPDFDAEALRAALNWYLSRQRRFGLTSEQIDNSD